MKNGWPILGVLGVFVTIFLFILGSQATEIKENRIRIIDVKEKTNERFASLENRLTRIELILELKFKDEARKADSILNSQ